VHDGSVILTTGELHFAVYQGKYGMIAAQANILTGMVLGTTLADDDVTCDHILTTPEFHTEALAVRFATVLGTTYTFLMSHDTGILFDLLDFQFGEGLAVTILYLVALPSFLLEYDHLVAFFM